MERDELPAPHLPAAAQGASACTAAARQRHHTLEVQARILEYNGESIVALIVRDNARGLDVDPVTVHLSLAEAVRVAEMLWGTVGDVRRADATGRVKATGARPWGVWIHDSAPGWMLTASAVDPAQEVVWTGDEVSAP